MSDNKSSMERAADAPPEKRNPAAPASANGALENPNSKQDFFTHNCRRLQAFRIAMRFGLPISTASAVVELAGIGGGA